MNKLNKLLKHFHDKNYISGKSGTQYYLNLDAITIKKAPDFERLTLQLMTAMQLPTIFSNFQKIANLTNPKACTMENIIGNTTEAHEIMINVMKGVNHYNDNPVSVYVMFCALFLVRPDEPNEFNEGVIKAKAEDWEEIPEFFFRTLSQQIANEYGQISQKMKTNLGQRKPKPKQEGTT